MGGGFFTRGLVVEARGDGGSLLLGFAPTLFLRLNRKNFMVPYASFSFLLQWIQRLELSRTRIGTALEVATLETVGVGGFGFPVDGEKCAAYIPFW